jgi:tetratricopeptide (TPR) repeat protein
MLDKNTNSAPALEPAEVRVPKLEDMLSPERVEKFAAGEMTLGQLYGITFDEAYSVAEIGYTMLEQGRLKDALAIFEGLIACNPFDPYFHIVLGSIYQKMGVAVQAIAEYSAAIELNQQSIEARANRGELLMQNGYFAEAAEDFKAAVELDPKKTHPLANRARALAAITASALKASLETAK